MIKFKLKKRVLLLASLLFLTIILTYYLFPLAKKDTLAIEYPMRFQVSDVNIFEHNPPNHCTGFTTAFVLRSNGIAGWFKSSSAQNRNVSHSLTFFLFAPTVSPTPAFSIV